RPGRAGVGAAVFRSAVSRAGRVDVLRSWRVVGCRAAPARVVQGVALDVERLATVVRPIDGVAAWTPSRPRLLRRGVRDLVALVAEVEDAGIPMGDHPRPVVYRLGGREEGPGEVDGDLVEAGDRPPGDADVGDARVHAV